MKIFKILPTIGLADPIKATEFAHNETKIVPDLPARKIFERFPFQPEMPVVNPDLVKQAGLERTYKFVSEMKVGDLELLKYSYQRIKDAENLRRLYVWRQKEEQAAAKAVRIEKENQDYRILVLWAQRHHMERVFHKLRIDSMDEFKRVMHEFHERSDERKRVQYHLFLKQAGADPAHLPPPLEWQRKTGRDLDLARIKLDLERKDLVSLHEMRHRLAEQNAALTLTREMERQRLLVSWEKDLDAIERDERARLHDRLIAKKA